MRWSVHKCPWGKRGIYLPLYPEELGFETRQLLEKHQAVLESSLQEISNLAVGLYSWIAPVRRRISGNLLIKTRIIMYLSFPRHFSNLLSQA